jgi:CsoR family transcriptional regulator, copper-sensing transcriptional repressor
MGKAGFSRPGADASGFSVFGCGYRVWDYGTLLKKEAILLTEVKELQSEAEGTGHDCCATSEDGERKSHHSDKVKSNLISRLNRIEGQVRGVKGLIERDAYCDDVLNQIASIQSALNGVGKLLLENHLKSCVVERIQEGDTEVITELLTTVNKLMK